MAVAAAALYFWMTQATPLPELRGPTAEGSLAEEQAAFRAAQRLAANNVNSNALVGVYRAFDGVAVNPASASWPGFRGPRRDNCATTDVALAESWPAAGPPVVWSMELGEGHAAPAVHRGRMYILDYDESRQGDVLRCFAVDSGRELWQRFYAVHTKRNHGISRTIPAVDDNAVVSLGPQCQVLAVNATNGAYRWSIDLVARYGTKVPLWYAGQCPLLDEGQAVLAPAGREALLIGVDERSGEVKWQTPNPDGWEMSHSCVMTLEVEGTRQYVYAALGGIAGVAADGPRRGELLWRTTAFSPTVVAPSPLPLPGGRFLMTAGYGAGSAMFGVTHSNDQWQVSLLFRTDRRIFGCEQQTPIFRDGMLIAVLPNDAGEHRQELAAMTPDGQALWTSGADRRFGLGPFLAVGERLLVLDDVGRLGLYAVSRGGCRRLAQADIMAGNGRDAWGPMALVDGRLLLRDCHRLYCLDLRAAQR